MHVDLLAAIGSDRALVPGELPVGVPGLEDVAAPWAAYEACFDRYTGALADPQFARLSHPASRVGAPWVAPGATIVIAGTGPSLHASAAVLRRARGQVALWTSLRGAEALAMHGLTADLVLVQHASDLDAHLTTRHLRDRDHRSVLAGARWVLADQRTPRALLAGVDASRLAIVDGAVGWGLWPATLAALALDTAAGSVALVGIDLGDARGLAPAHVPLGTVLGLLPRARGERTLDAGAGGAPKAGWRAAPLDAIIAPVEARTEMAFRPWARGAYRLEALRDDLRRVAPYVAAAREAAMLARAARDGHPVAESALEARWRELVACGRDRRVRVALQEGLGVRFLPRFWRMHASRHLRGPAWRPLLLAAEEIRLQAQVAERTLEHQEERVA